MDQINRKKFFAQFFSVLVLFFLCSRPSSSYETDQYTHRDVPLRDSLKIMDRKMNAELNKLVLSWKQEYGQDENRFVSLINSTLGNAIVEAPLETWLKHERLIDRFHPDDHVYSEAPPWASRFNYFYGVCTTMLINGVRLGTDKVSHFIAQGYTYYQIAIMQGQGELAATQWGSEREDDYMGIWFTGVYSNGDLAANYDGYLFYLSLFHDNVVPGKKAIIRWDNGMPTLQRPFTWADYVTEYWDESLNPSKFTPSLQWYVHRRLLKLCDDYWAHPDRYTLKHKKELDRKYANAGFRDAPENLISNICK